MWPLDEIFLARILQDDAFASGQRKRVRTVRTNVRT